MHYQETSREAWENFVPHSAKLDRLIMEQIYAAGTHGVACFKIEAAIARKHEAVSGNLRHLVEKGLVEDSGYRDVRGGARGLNEVIRWRVKPLTKDFSLPQKKRAKAMLDKEDYEQMNMNAAPHQTPDPYTDEVLIAKYFEIKTYCEEHEKRLAEKLKGPRAGMQTIKDVLLARFNQRGSTNTKTEAGTAFASKRLDVKVIDRQAFLQYCIAHWSTFGADMLQIGAVVGPVRERMEAEETPPGIETSTTVTISIRSPK
ncbi:MAG TPA: hypothetical protein VF748_14710 [Candidatus Acidoferrum sp.]